MPMPESQNFNFDPEEYPKAAEEQVSVTPETMENLDQRLQSARALVDRIEKEYPDMPKGSRFQDIARNTLTACITAWRYFKTTHGKEDYECITSRLPELEEYLDLIEHYSDFFERERMNQKGAFPDIVAAADRLYFENRKFRIIPYYISEAKKRLEPLTESVQ